MKNTNSAKKTLIGIQDAYIATVNTGIARWSHRKDGGHSSRILRGARHAAERGLRSIGYTDQAQIDQIVKDAKDVAALERCADE